MLFNKTDWNIFLYNFILNFDFPIQINLIIRNLFFQFYLLSSNHSIHPHLKNFIIQILFDF
jgi:hypothetical protein